MGVMLLGVGGLELECIFLVGCGAAAGEGTGVLEPGRFPGVFTSLGFVGVGSIRGILILAKNRCIFLMQNARVS